MPTLQERVRSFEAGLSTQLNQLQGTIASSQALRQTGEQITQAMRNQMTQAGLPQGHMNINGATNGQVWTIWVQDYISASTTSTTNNIRLTMTDGSSLSVQGCRTWIEWNRPFTTSTTNTISIGQNGIVWNNWLRTSPNARVSEEERARRVAEETRWREAEAQRRRDAEEANARAELLLNQCLSDEQREDLQRKGCFYLHVADKKYRIKRGFAGNVELVDSESDRAVYRYCIHPRDRVPDADAMLAQKLLLESNEAEFIRVANRS